MKKVSSEWVKKILEKGADWKEGLDLVGYWPEGDSLILKDDKSFVCISTGFLREVLKQTGKR